MIDYCTLHKYIYLQLHILEHTNGDKLFQRAFSKVNKDIIFRQTHFKNVCYLRLIGYQKANDFRQNRDVSCFLDPQTISQLVDILCVTPCKLSHKTGMEQVTYYTCVYYIFENLCFTVMRTKHYFIILKINYKWHRPCRNVNIWS